MNTYSRISILIALFLVSCQSNYSVQPSPENVPTLPSTSIETLIPTEAIEVIPSITPTRLDQNSRVVELPRWVRYSFPGGVLVLPYNDSSKDNPTKVVFVNPNDGEKFVIDLMIEFYYYYWKDSEHIVLFHEGNCDTSPKYISDLNVADGNFQLYRAENYLGKIVPCYFHSDDEIVRLNNSFSEKVVEYIDQSNGEVFQLTDPDDGTTDLSVQLSRDKNFLAIVQYDGDYKIPEANEPIYGNKISVYDLKTRQLLLQYYEEQGILSEVSFLGYSELSYMRENTPCLIRILSQTKKCIHNIPSNFPDSTIILSQHSYHDGLMLRFLHFSKQESGYCFYDLFSGKLGCVTDRFSAFHDQFILNYSISYYGHYLLIEYSDEGCPVFWCDYPDDTYLAVINSNEGELIELGNSSLYNLSQFYRPLRPYPWQPWLY